MFPRLLHEKPRRSNRSYRSGSMEPFLKSTRWSTPSNQEPCFRRIKLGQGNGNGCDRTFQVGCTSSPTVALAVLCISTSSWVSEGMRTQNRFPPVSFFSRRAISLFSSSCVVVQSNREAACLLLLIPPDDNLPCRKPTTYYISSHAFLRFSSSDRLSLYGSKSCNFSL